MGRIKEMSRGYRWLLPAAKLNAFGKESQIFWVRGCLVDKNFRSLTPGDLSLQRLFEGIQQKENNMTGIRNCDLFDQRSSHFYSHWLAVFYQLYRLEQKWIIITMHHKNKVVFPCQFIICYFPPFWVTKGVSLDSIRNNNNAPFCCWQFVSRVALASAKLWYSGFFLLGLSHCWESWLFPSFHYACPMAISSNLFGYFWGEFQKRKKKHIGLKKRVKTCSCAHKIPSGDLSFIQQKEENWVTSLWITNPHLLCCVC